MIQSIRLTLQSHKNSLIEFHPGVNYIIGKSRQGKSTILRGLIKVGWNRPVQGMERWVHRHDPRNIPDVEIVTTEGHSVEWRGGSPQTYTVDGEELSGFGQGVPQAVTDALRLGELNISGQHDRPFLLFDTPGEVARTLNRVVRLDVIDRTLANWAAEKRRNDREVQAQEARIAELKGQEAAFPDLEAGSAILDSLEAKERERQDKAEKIAGLETLGTQLAELRAALAALRVPEGMGEALAWLFDRQAELEVKDRQLFVLNRLNSDIRDYSVRLQQLEPGLRQENEIAGFLAMQRELEAKSARLAGLEAIQESLGTLAERSAYLSRGLKHDRWVSELLTKSTHLQAKRRHLARLLELNRQVMEAGKAVEAKQAIISQMEKQIKKEFGDRCPLCGQGVRK